MIKEVKGVTGKMYGLKEAAEILDISYITLYRLISKGRVKAVKIGSTIKITDEELERIKKEGA